jgi:hypothetical protein
VGARDVVPGSTPGAALRAAFPAAQRIVSSGVPREAVRFLFQGDVEGGVMGRMSFTQELKALATASEGMDAGDCWRKAVVVHRELGRPENALGRAAWTMRYGQRGEWRTILRDTAAETLREARRAASSYDQVRLKDAAACYLRLAGCRYADAAALMLKAGERGGANPGDERRERRFEHVAPEIRWTVERPNRNGQRRRGEGRSRPRHRKLAAAA